LFALKVRYKLNTAGTVTFTLKRKKSHRLVKVRGKLIKSGKAGKNSFTVNGKIGGHKLGPGTYQLIATPAAGTPQKVTFKIVA
jgi:hypothetical protein